MGAVSGQNEARAAVPVDATVPELAEKLRRVWMGGVPFEPGGGINWRRFAEALIAEGRPVADFDLRGEVARRAQRVLVPVPERCAATVGPPGTAAEAMRCQRVAEHPGDHWCWPVRWGRPGGAARELFRREEHRP